MNAIFVKTLDPGGDKRVARSEGVIPLTSYTRAYRFCYAKTSNMISVKHCELHACVSIAPVLAICSW